MATHVLVDRDGYTVTDDEQFELDQSCVQQCCEGGGPLCCPSPCGKRFVLCVSDLFFEDLFHAVADYEGQHFDGTFRYTLELIGGPWILEPVVGSDGCQLYAEGQIRVRETNERLGSSLCEGQFQDSRSVREFCAIVRVPCPGEPADVSNPPELTIRHPFSAGVGVPPIGPLGIGRNEYDVGPLPSPAWGPQTLVVQSRAVGFPAVGSFTSTTNSQGSAHTGVGPGGLEIQSWDGLATKTNTGTGFTGCLSTTFFHAFNESRRIEWRMRATLKVVEDCDGNITPPCNGTRPVECAGPRPVIRGRACGDPNGSSNVYLLRENVESCGVVMVAAAGDGICYKFDPAGPLFGDLPVGGVIGDEVVNSASARTCCECGPSCDKTDLAQVAAGMPCWKNAFRRPDGVLEITPITAAGVCCCFPDDVITVGILAGELRRPGVRPQRWVLRPFRFRRDDPTPINADRAAWSDVYDLDTGEFLFPFQHGPVSDNGIGCGWTGGLGNFLQFGLPQNGASVQPVAEGALPCPDAGDVTLNGWRITRYSISPTCDGFVYQGEFENVNDGGTFVARTTVSVARNPEAEGRPCGGGCAGVKPAGGGGSVAGAGLLTASGGCQGCAGDGRID